MLNIFDKVSQYTSAFLAVSYDGRPASFKEEFCDQRLKASFEYDLQTPFRAGVRIGTSEVATLLQIDFSAGTLVLHDGLQMRQAGEVVILAVEGDCWWQHRGTRSVSSSAVIVLPPDVKEFQLAVGATSLRPAKLFYIRTSSKLFKGITRPHFISSAHAFGAVSTYLYHVAEVNADKLNSIYHAIFRRKLTYQGSAASQDTAYFEAIMKFIDANLPNDALGCDMIARNFGISKRKVYDIFKHNGALLQETIISKRLTVIKEAIDAGSEKVASIIFAYGFSTPSTFYRNYRKYYGSPPRRDAV